MTPYRSLSECERALVDRILAADCEGRGKIPGDWPARRVRAIDENGSLEFEVGTDAAGTPMQKYPAEAVAIAPDGVEIHALLFISEGMLRLLDFYKDDGEPVSMPPVDEFSVIVPSTR